MASSSRTTKDHDEIKNWAEERGGKPAHVSNTGSKDDIGILRIEFPGAPGSNDSKLEELAWDQFFEKFDERGLALLYQEQTASGERSNFNKLVSSETAAEADERASTAGPRKRASKKAVAKKAAKKATPVKKASAKKTAPAKKTTAKKAAAKTSASSRNAAFRPTKKTVAKKKTASSTKKTAKRAPAKAAASKRGAAQKKSSRGRR